MFPVPDATARERIFLPARTVMAKARSNAPSRLKSGSKPAREMASASVSPEKATPGLMADRRAILYVIIRTADHPVFHREGDDIRITVPVTATEAALGAKIEVPTIDGRTLLKIPPGTQSGQKLRLREKGVPSAPRKARAATRLSKSSSPYRCLATNVRRKSCASWRS